MKKEKPVYVLGTGLSHDGSACLLKDGKIVVAIEKERITRVKHDGMNDSIAIKYCLDAEGITLNDIDLVVQNANFGSFEFGNDFFSGKRFFGDTDIPIVTISHHLAHAYNAIGTSPFKDTAVLVIDGCGSLADDCMDIGNSTVPQKMEESIKHLYAEKDSFYNYTDGKCVPLFKDFSPLGMIWKNYPMHPPTTQHSIGGMYYAASGYCFGNLNDAGKLMGLAPYGRPGIFKEEIFEMTNGRLFVKYDWMKTFKKPARNYEEFKNDFQYYADVAFWVQKEVEKAVMYVISQRSELTDSQNLSYTGGVALNAVANQFITKNSKFKNVYITPAAGDNGLAIGCAFYGWLEVLKKERVFHNGNSCFGRLYSDNEMGKAIRDFSENLNMNVSGIVKSFFEIMPKCVVADNIKVVKSKLQFTITDCGIFSLYFKDGKCEMKAEPCLKPEVAFTMQGKTFIDWMLTPPLIGDLIKNNVLKVEGNPAFLQSWFNFEMIKNKMKSVIADSGSAEEKISFKKEDDIVSAAAKLLADGKVIGWFQEGSEFGPRALGHRSILADPRRKDIQGFINAKIKFREDFRPFAPSVIREDVSKYFQYDGDSPYMIMVAQVQPEWKEKIPGVVHKNGSCRIQTVTADWNARYYDLLKKFEQQTGVGVLLNTSFNKRGMPIVETPEQALSLFHECAIDYLVIGDYLIAKDSEISSGKVTADHMIEKNSGVVSGR